ncbi:hypothetical protein EV188_103541 [Actinomycetospora succinea]|uniref:Uncharacterized protein n=1 Tax=Actinomycetospora succinea TaxID=663603 RepID=A0A4R6VNS9_9PSEU|nr:hypothetical protein [Actinomycetospora succinea]TDQ61035.1 hypothetical protein EV188_103541 [Actinomycetospora succinea]
MGVKRVDSAVAHAAGSSTTRFEAAVVIEGAGVNDRVASQRYGAADVFDLAGRLVADRRRPRSEPAAAPPRRTWSTAGDPRWLPARGVLYAVPAVVALALLPSEDPVSATLMLGGLVLAWAAAYGVASVAWSYLGNLDRPAARRFLRRALLVGTGVALVLAVAAVFGALVLTATMSVDLVTVVLLTGQAAYLLAAAALLLCGREAWLLGALLPAVVGAVLGLLVPHEGPASALANPTSGVPARDLLWPAASVVLAVVLALVATRGGRRPVSALPRSAWTHAGAQVGFGLFVAVLVLFPALEQLLDPGFDPLPLTLTSLALPLVLTTGVAEWLLVRFRERTGALLAATGSASRFARGARHAALRAHLLYLVALTGATVLFGAAVAVSMPGWDVRLVLLGADYVVLGTALFAAAVATALGRGDRVLALLAAAVAGLAAFIVRGQAVPASGTAAILWHLGTGVVLLAVLGVLVRRSAGVPVRHR